MKTKIIRLVGSAILALAILAGCDSDDAFRQEPYVRGVDYGWGYMKGYVHNLQTGETYPFDHVNHPSLKSRQGHRSEYKFYGDPDKRIQFRHMTFFYDDREAINHYEGDRTASMPPSRSTINLTLLGGYKEGRVEIVDSENFVRLEDGSTTQNLNSSISIEIYDDAEKFNHWGVKPLRYVPRDDNPFIVHLDTIEFDKRNLVPPVMEGSLAGVLYREDDPKDQVAIYMKFGM